MRSRSTSLAGSVALTVLWFCSPGVFAQNAPSPPCAPVLKCVPTKDAAFRCSIGVKGQLDCPFLVRELRLTVAAATPLRKNGGWTLRHEVVNDDLLIPTYFALEGTEPEFLFPEVATQEVVLPQDQELEVRAILHLDSSAPVTSRQYLLQGPTGPIALGVHPTILNQKRSRIEVRPLEEEPEQ